MEGSLLILGIFSNHSETALKTIGLYVKRSSPEAAQAAKEAIAWLQSKGHSVVCEESLTEEYGISGGVPPEEFGDKAELIIVLGGDGTFLAGARLASVHGIPICGVNLGGLGFLTDIPASEMIENLELVLNGQAQIEHRTLLDVTIHRNGKTDEFLVLNDAVIAKSALARIIEIHVSTHEALVTNIFADGLIVSTPTGSTAYSMAAGGPICHPEVDAIVLTPICPHLLAARPIIVPGDSPLKIELKTDGETYVTMDGQRGMDFRIGDWMHIRKCDTQLTVLRNPNRTYYQTIREKLRWGQR